MTVFVDTSKYAYGRMVMCHMVAHTTEELLAMADAIGVEHRHLQHAGTPREHFDICKAKRALAVKAGAQEFTQRDMARFLACKRAGLPYIPQPSPTVIVAGSSGCAALPLVLVIAVGAILLAKGVAT